MVTSYSPFTELLKREAQAVAALCEVLQGEHAALVERDATAMESTAVRKGQLVEQLNGLGEQRAALLAAAGLSPDKAGFEALLVKASGEGEEALQHQWQQLREKLQHCQQQNQVNSQLLEAGRRHAEEALSLLRGQGPISEIYGQDGARNGGGGSRSYAKV